MPFRSTRTAELYAAIHERLRGRRAPAYGRRGPVRGQFQIAAEGCASGMAVMAPDGRHLSVNRALCEITGYSEEELLARRFQDVTHSSDFLVDIDQRHALLEGAVDGYETEIRYVHRDGSEALVRMAVSVALGDGGDVLYVISHAHGVPKRRSSERGPGHRALHDTLTGLPNRALFLDRLRHALVRAARGSGELAILFVALDRFHLVNNDAGQGAGDVVLRQAAKRLSAAARAGDTVARFGGDGFTVICEGVDEEQACQMAARVLAAFARPFTIGEREIQLSASVGIRVGDMAAGDADSRLRDAEAALEVAKQRGGARFEVFDPNAPVGAPSV